MGEWFQGIVKYFGAVRQEIKRITWPTMPELRAATIVVIVTMAVVSGYLFVVDKFFGQLVLPWISDIFTKRGH